MNQGLAVVRSLSFDLLGVQLAFEEAFATVLSTHASRGRLDGAIEQMAASSPFAPAVGGLDEPSCPTDRQHGPTSSRWETGAGQAARGGPAAQL
jgi:hypothetical protein